MGPKKVKLSPSQRKAARAEKRAAKKRAAIALKQKIQYEHLEREIKYGSATISKHEKNWRKMLMDIAVPQMHAELEYAWHNFERAFDAKDFTISLLMDEIREADEQYMMNMRSHMSNIDNLIVLCNDQIAGLRNESKEVILQLYNAATVERNDIINITKVNEEYLKTMLYMLENAKKESEKLIRGEYLSKQEVEIGKLDDICTKFTEELEAKFDLVWKDSHRFLKNHITECKSRKREYLKLRKQDDIMQIVTRKLWERIRKNFDVIKTLKNVYSDKYLTLSRKIKELTDELNHFESVFKVVKSRLESERILDEMNLTHLTLESNETIKFLEGIEKKGEKLLKLSAICRKYETQEEKTMPFPIFNDPPVKEVEIEVSGYRKELLLFWNRVAQVDASRYKMIEECQYLKMQNSLLKERIHDYCQCLNCEALLPVDFADNSD
ncbi:PREDICTED: coiled-coil domain-containing protein 65 [Nicrophorus vespilloides]|uniref:Dynein regulatory complex subunit 2 n=1 Tax=Nicrophorus vespilloides TaxID=110193 RepID=A0ABM1N5D2_NICVS|nr:PREDICTED: coiled-coil domain-containing protein 65 [Nicrophorus vespilloides]